MQIQKQGAQKPQAEAADVAAAHAVTRPDVNATLKSIGAALKKPRRKMKPEVARALKILKRTRELLSDKDRWIRGAWIRVRRRGQAFEGQFCLQGAVRYVAAGEPSVEPSVALLTNQDLRHHSYHGDAGGSLAEAALREAVGKKTNYWSIPAFNDRLSGRDKQIAHPRVLEVIDSAIAQLKKESKAP